MMRVRSRAGRAILAVTLVAVVAGSIDWRGVHDLHGAFALFAFFLVPGLDVLAVMTLADCFDTFGNWTGWPLHCSHW